MERSIASAFGTGAAIREMVTLRARLQSGAAGDVSFSLSPNVTDLYGKPRGALQTDRSLVSYLLDVANGDTDRSEIRAALVSGRREIPFTVRDWKHFSKIYAETCKTARLTASRVTDLQLYDFIVDELLTIHLRRFVTFVFYKRPDALKNFFDETAQGLRSVLTVPIFRQTARGPILEYHTPLLDARSFEAFASFLLLDPSRGIARDLCQCQLEDCCNYFLMENKRGRRPRFCSIQHMRMAHDLAAPERMRKARAHKQTGKPE